HIPRHFALRNATPLKRGILLLEITANRDGHSQAGGWDEKEKCHPFGVMNAIYRRSACGDSDGGINHRFALTSPHSSLRDSFPLSLIRRGAREKLNVIIGLRIFINWS